MNNREATIKPKWANYDTSLLLDFIKEYSVFDYVAIGDAIAYAQAALESQQKDHIPDVGKMVQSQAQQQITKDAIQHGTGIGLVVDGKLQHVKREDFYLSPDEIASQAQQEPAKATNLFEIVTHGKSGDAWLLLRADEYFGLGHHCIKFEGSAADDLRKRFKVMGNMQSQAQQPLRKLGHVTSRFGGDERGIFIDDTVLQSLPFCATLYADADDQLSSMQSQAQQDDYASHDTSEHHKWLKKIEAKNAGEVNELVCDISQAQQTESKQGCKECDGQTYIHSLTGEYLGECPFCTKEEEPYAYDVPTKDGTELVYAIYFTKYNNPLPEGAIPLYTSQQEPVSQWISVEERLPDTDTFVDVLLSSSDNINYKKRVIEVPFVASNFKVNTFFDAEYVSHWVPLPKRPNED